MPSPKPNDWGAEMGTIQENVSHLTVRAATPEEVAEVTDALGPADVGISMLGWTIMIVLVPEDVPLMVVVGDSPSVIGMPLVLPIQAYDPAAQLIRTATGEVYRLGDRSTGKPTAGQFAELNKALVNWGFQDEE